MNDLPLLEYAASLKLDAVFLQDSIDPGTKDPAHWKQVKEAAARLGLQISSPPYDPVPGRLQRPYELIGWNPPRPNA